VSADTIWTRLGHDIATVPVFGGVYNGSDCPFDLTWLRMLDTKLANACLDYLIFDRLGVNEVHMYLLGGAVQLHRWLSERASALARWRIPSVISVSILAVRGAT